MNYDRAWDFGDGDHDFMRMLASEGDGDNVHVDVDDDDNFGSHRYREYNELSAARSDLRNHRMIRVEQGSPIQSMVHDDLEKLARDFSTMREMDSLQVCVGPIGTPNVPPDRSAARLAATVITGMTSVRCLRLSFFSLFEHVMRPSLGDPGEAVAWEIGAREALDSFLAQISCSSVRLSQLELDCFGQDADPWNRFADRLAPTIEFLEIDARFINSDPLASAFAASLQGCFRSLVEFRLNNAIRHCPVEPVKLALNAISCSTTIQNLTVVLAERTDESEHKKAVADQLSYLAKVVNQSPSLKELTLRSDSQSACDVAALLDGLLYNETLAELRLVALHLGITNISSSRQDQALSVNKTLTRIVLSRCRVGENGVALISRYKGLESVDFKGVEIELPAGAMEKRIFENLGNIVSFSDETNSSDHLEWVAANISAGPSLKEASLSLSSVPLPPLVDVLSNCPATCEMSLELHGDANVPFLCTGMDGADKLATLNVTLHRATRVTAAAILESVQANSVLTRFTCKLRNLSGDDVENVGPRLQALLSNNRTLERFGCSCYSSFAFPVARNALKYAIRGLCRNRHLVTVEFGSTQTSQAVTVDRVVSEEIVRMLQGNTTLQQIEGLAYASQEHEAQINSLLELNRHGRDFGENGHRVPVNLWGEVLMRISNEDCNRFVTELARKALVLPDGRRANPPQDECCGIKRCYSAAAQCGGRKGARKHE
jgi:hypothetical protein